MDTLPPPSRILQAFFMLAALTIVLLNSVPAIRRHLISYGPRAVPSSPTSSNKGSSSESRPEQAPRPEEGLQVRLVSAISHIQVPHGFFLHFYVASVISSVFWGVQLSVNGSWARWLCEREGGGVGGEDDQAMSINQITVAWALVTIQGSRRLYESVSVSKASTSRMFFVHWILGIGFYLALGIAIWIEGAGSLIAAGNSRSTFAAVHNITIAPPSPKMLIGVPMFLLASGFQYDCHYYLASLKKYSLPTQHPLFHALLCPHYTAECVIYIALAVISAPPGQLVNQTMLTAFVFAATNLAVTAKDTEQWYRIKFGDQAVKERKKMVPYLW